MSYIMSEATGRCHWVEPDVLERLYPVDASTGRHFDPFDHLITSNHDDDYYNQSTTTMTVKTTWDTYDLIVETARLRFVNFLDTEADGVTTATLPQKFTTACYDFYKQCLFADAQVCIRDELASWRSFVVYVPFAVVLVLVAFVFNSLSAYFVSRNQNKYPRHTILQSLAVSDTLLSLFTVLKRSLDFLPHAYGSASTMPFLLFNAIWQACWIVSACGVLMLSLDCFVATRFPFFYRKAKLLIGVKLLIGCIWIFAVIITALLAHFNLQYLSDIQYVVCSLMVCILTVVVIECLYVFMLAERVRQEQKRYFYDNRNHIRLLSRNRKRSLATISIIMTCTFICWLPLLVYFLLPESVHADNLQLSQNFLVVCLICFHINGTVNPIIYSFRFKDVRLPMQRNFTQSALLRPIGNMLQRAGTSSTIASLGLNPEIHRYLSTTRHRHSDPNNVMMYRASSSNNSRRNSSSVSASVSGFSLQPAGSSLLSSALTTTDSSFHNHHNHQHQQHPARHLYGRHHHLMNSRSNLNRLYYRKMSSPATLLSSTIPSHLLSPGSQATTSFESTSDLNTNSIADDHLAMYEEPRRKSLIGSSLQDIEDDVDDRNGDSSATRDDQQELEEQVQADEPLLSSNPAKIETSLEEDYDGDDEDC